MNNTDDFKIWHDGSLEEYIGPSGDIVVPEGIKDFGFFEPFKNVDVDNLYLPDSFDFYNYQMPFATGIHVNLTHPKLKSVDGVLYNKEGTGLFFCPAKKTGILEIPATVTYIAGDAFTCGNALSSISVHEGNEKYFSKEGILYRKEENGKVALMFCPNKYTGVLTIPNFVDEIYSYALQGCKEVSELQFEGKIPMIPQDALCGTKLSIAHEILQRNVKLPIAFTESSATFTSEDLKWLVIGQSTKAWKEVLARLISVENPVIFLNGMLDILATLKKISKDNALNVLEYTLAHIDEINKEQLTKLHNIFTVKKCKDALSAMAMDSRVNDILNNDSVVNADSLDEADVIEQIVRANWKRTEIKDKLQKIIKKGISFKDGGGCCSPQTLIFVIASYAEQLDDSIKCYSEYQTAFVKAKIVAIADQVAEALNQEHLVKVLEKLAYKEQYFMDGYLLAFGRYASSEKISKLITKMREWENWGRYKGTGRKTIIIARGALMLSDTKEAIMAIDKVKALDYYAAAREIDVDTLRDMILTDFGFDKNGKKIYDLGGNKVSVLLENDLSMSIFDENAGKTVKSIPKKGASVELYENAKKDFSELKKNIKRVAENRKNILFEAFLSGKTYVPENWKKSYLENPVLNTISNLIVWKQDDMYFTTTRGGFAISSSGEMVTLDENTLIAVAHPIEMSESEIISWQEYFVKNGLKQPFEQIWEPVYKEEDIKENRYNGCSISVYKFAGKEIHGIKTSGLGSYSETFDFELTDCKLSATSDTWRFIPGVTDEAMYNLGEFKIKKFSRYVNHIVFLLDQWTIEERIIKNDPAIGELLNGFTAAQLLNFISLASEKNSTNSLAVLMEYKSAKFDQYDPFMEFTLE